MMIPSTSPLSYPSSSVPITAKPLASDPQPAGSTIWTNGGDL